MAYMEKIKYHKQESDLVDRLLRFLAAEGFKPVRNAGIVTEPATIDQLELLAKLGIYPKWQTTRYEAEEMIFNYKIIIGSAK